MFESLSITPSFKNSIMSAINMSRLSHAVIFEGTDEKTRLAAAEETAKAILCKGDVKPCGKCSSCFKAESLSHPDLHFLKKSDDSTMIKVDAIRELRSKALVYPNDGDKSVFIIHEAQFMNVQAQNALLKIFEEPSGHVCFILTCDSKSSMLDTIISRATSYSLGEANDLKDDEEMHSAVQKAEELISCFINENELSFLRRTAVFAKDKSLFKLTLQAMVPIIRDALILQSGGKDLISKSKNEAEMLKDRLTRKKTTELIGAIQNLIDETEKAANHNLTITRFSALLYNIKSN